MKKKEIRDADNLNQGDINVDMKEKIILRVDKELVRR